MLVPNRIVLADDEIAANEWECDLYRAGVPSDIAVDFVTLDEAAARVPEWQASTDRTLILIGDVDSLGRWCNNAPDIKEVNLGGLHKDVNRRERLSYLYLSESEVTQLRELKLRGITIRAQDLPNASPVALEEIL